MLDAVLHAESGWAQEPPAPPAGYVADLFDRYADDFSSHLSQLDYRAPDILVKAAMGCLSHPWSHVLDLGCGTGLVGQCLQGNSLHVDGVDLSPAMIEKARARGLYDQLMVADLETALAEAGPRYDLILAADTLVYLGDLRGVFNGVRARLAPEGYFLFTTEAKSGDGFELGPKRRWRHSDAYLRATAQAAGLSLAGLVAATPRFEANQPVEGFAVALTA